jgi:hypothetical protein
MAIGRAPMVKTSVDSDAGGRTLNGSTNEGWLCLDLEDCRESVADVDRTGILPDPEHLRPASELAKQCARSRTAFDPMTPKRRARTRTPEQVDESVLVSRETPLDGQVRDGRLASGPGRTGRLTRPAGCRLPRHACTERKSLSPFPPPASRSVALDAA